MTTGQRHELAGVITDGWFERVMGSVPELERLCEVLGEALVALSLAAGLRVVALTLSRDSGEVAGLQWVRDDDAEPSNERATDGSVDQFRTAVLAVLLSESEFAGAGSLSDPAVLRNVIGLRTLLLAPLFGLRLKTLEASEGTESRITVSHDRGEETVTLRQLRRFLQGRVVEALRPRSSGLSIDLAQAEPAKADLDEGRNDSVIARLGPWVAPLTMLLRTPEGQSMPQERRATLALAMRTLGIALDRMGRPDEAEEVLRLGAQWALDGTAGATLYSTLAGVLVAQGRRPESIGLYRRALTLDASRKDWQAELALGFVDARRSVAALGIYRTLVAEGFESAAMETLRERLESSLGNTLAPYETQLEAPVSP